MSDGLKAAVLTVSDTRTEENDTSGDFLCESLQAAGHSLTTRKIVIDDMYQLRACISAWIADGDIEVILVTGGTGFTTRDSTPEALTPLFDTEITGFGELFRQLSYDDIGTSTCNQERSQALPMIQSSFVCRDQLVLVEPRGTGFCRSNLILTTVPVTSRN